MGNAITGYSSSSSSSSSIGFWRSQFSAHTHGDTSGLKRKRQQQDEWTAPPQHHDLIQSKVALYYSLDIKERKHENIMCEIESFGVYTLDDFDVMLGVLKEYHRRTTNPFQHAKRCLVDFFTAHESATASVGDTPPLESWDDARNRYIHYIFTNQIQCGLGCENMHVL